MALAVFTGPNYISKRNSPIYSFIKQNVKNQFVFDDSVEYHENFTDDSDLKKKQHKLEPLQQPYSPFTLFC